MVRLYSHVAVLLLLFGLCSVDAYRKYRIRFPNPDIVPCADGNCGGLPYCEGIGHTSCTWQPGNSPRNQFGDDFKHGPSTTSAALGGPWLSLVNNQTNPGGEIWSVNFCMADSDGDGRTNGDEMGDACCIWNYGNPYPRTTAISHPASNNSVTTASSCLLQGAPQAPVGVALVKAGNGNAFIAWEPPLQCVCSFHVSVSDGVRDLAKIDWIPSTQPNVTLCSLQTTQSNVYITVFAANLAGASPATTINVSMSRISASVPNFAPTCTVTQTPAMAGVVSAPDEPFIWPAVVGVIFALCLLLAAFIVRYSFKNHPSKDRVLGLLNQKAIHTFASGNVLVDCVSWIGEFSVLQLFGVLCFLAVQVCFYLYGWQLEAVHTYLWGGQETWARAIGQVNYINFALVMLPVTKRSIWIHLLGVPFERVIQFHRYLARWYFILASIHGFGMIAGYWNTIFGSSYILQWSDTQNSNSNVSALIAWVCFAVMFGTSLSYFRRNMFSLFYSTHMLFVVGVIMIMLHSNTAAGYIAPALSLYGLDLLAMFADWYFRPVTVVSAETIDGGANERYVRLTLRKPRFSYEAGQYLMVMIPKLSLINHPFSISSAPRVDDDTFTLHIKCMGENSFTSKLYDLCAVGDTKFLVLATGPFGRPSVNMSKYQHVILIAGGIGITPIAPVWADLHQRPSKMKRAVLCWSFRSVTLFKEFHSRLRETLLESGDKETPFEERFHNTGGEQVEGDVPVLVGRPDVYEMLTSLALACPANEAVGVFVCGPEELKLSVLAAAQTLHRTCGGPQIHVHCETFVL